MWEAIQANQRRSIILISLMGALMVLLGYAIGALIDMETSFHAGHFKSLAVYRTVTSDRVLDDDWPQVESPKDNLLHAVTLSWRGGVIGAGAACAIWLILMAVAFAQGERILLAGMKAREILSKEHAPQLWNIVEEMTIASGVGKMPRIYILDDEQMNAFAAGVNPDKAILAVTAGLLRKLNRDELQGVIAHEMGHIKNYDVKFMTIAGVMLGTIVLISDLFLRSLWYGGGRGRRSGRGGGQGAIIVFVFALLLAVLAPIVAQLLFFACSRRREYLADASSARFTRYPEGLASALQKISAGDRGAGDVNRVVAPMYIVNPLESSSWIGWFSTHPPTEKRIEVLRSMAGGAGWTDYQESFKKVVGHNRSGVGASVLSTEGHIDARLPSVETETRQDYIERARGVGGILDLAFGYIPLVCSCGLTIKVPEHFRHPSIQCPRCGRTHEVPQPQADQPYVQEPDKVLVGTKLTEPALAYRRTGTGWESFQCRCGKTVQISPAFCGKAVSCKHCGRHVRIISADEQT